MIKPWITHKEWLDHQENQRQDQPRWIKPRFNKNYVSSGDVFEVSKEITRIKQDNTTKINFDWLTNPNAERNLGNKRPLKAIRNDFNCLNTCPECGAKQHD